MLAQAHIERKDTIMKKLIISTTLLCLPANLQVYSSQSLLVKEIAPLLTKKKAPNPVVVTVPKTLSPRTVARMIENAGFPKEVVPVMTCLAEYESNFKPHAINKNTNNTHDYGLLQINSLWLKKEGCNLSANDLLNPEKNVACAYKVYKTQGLTAWTTYNKFKHTCLAYEVNGMNHKTLLAEAKIIENEELM